MGQPSDEEIRKLVFSGYFLHIARKMNVRRATTPNYFAIHSSVNGVLDRTSAIFVNNDKSNNLAELDSAPVWIVFEKILRLSFKTIFPLATPIELSWLFEESPEFYRLCLDQEDALPTQKIVMQCSQPCLKELLGKFWAKLDPLEEELGCSLEIEMDHGIIIAYCSILQKTGIQEKLRAKIDAIVSLLSSQTVEEAYLGGTRLVVGAGLEVKEVLFSNEFMTLMIRGLPDAKDKLGHHLVQLGVSSGLEGTPNFFQYQNQAHGANLNAVLKFNSKWKAKEALDLLKSSQFHGSQPLNAAPLLGTRDGKGVYQHQLCRWFPLL